VLALAFVLADVPGFAEIRQPSAGQSVSGVVSIVGTASHPAFESYELAFGFDPDPTDTWFAIGEALDTPVIDGRLAIWDSSGISDGAYRIRLLVHLQGQDPLEAIVSGIQVRNYTPTEVPAAAAAVAATPIAAGELPQAAAAVEDRVTPPDPFDRALARGIGLGAGLLLAFALYAVLAPRLRNYAAYVKTRRLHGRVERMRGGGRRG
jgi:hypothetical protein